MKKMGIIRSIDELGRIVIPKEMRKVLGINNKDELEIAIENEKIVISRKVTGCVFCDAKENLSEIKNNKQVCIDCLSDLHL